MRINDNLTKITLCLLLVVFSLLSVGLSSKKPDPVPVWQFEQNSVYINYSADKKLNFFNDKPHTLIVIIYQLTRIDAFNVLVNTEEGLKKLLQEERFDPSVASLDKIIIQPGEKKIAVFDRVENAKWVGIVAGYYELIPGQVNQTYQIPVIFGKKGWLRSTKTVKIGKLHIDVNFGSKTFLKAGTVDGTR